MRWFDGLKPNSVNYFKQLTQAFGSCFITSSRVPRPLDSLLSLSMREGETLKAYSNRYWEMYNEIEGNYDDVAISTFKRGLPIEHGLRKSLTEKPVTNVRQLIDRIDKYKKVEEVQMASDPTKRNQNLYCQYHQELGHTTDDCRNLKNHSDQLVREGKLRHLLHHSNGRQEQTNVEARQSTLRSPIGTINVVLAAPGRIGSQPFRVMSVARFPAEVDDRESKRAKGMASPMLGFSDEDKVGTI
ncbi:uncharacterized protein LOC115971746 [Quercus lobata]|uniref:uncharacterized protein LOC115971746 n=1 Tax=Quercus lobata TaxID=97700 RepID=UPI00124579F0|nr:uncharacterized protein LOC115971746 [Quercus lobata]